jgi:pyruvate carboxylase subunit B
LGRTFLQERNAHTLTPETLLPIEAKSSGDCTRFAADEFRVTLHGETYHIRLTGTGHGSQTERPYYVSVDGITEEVFVEALNEVEISANGSSTGKAKSTQKASNTGRPRPTHAGHVTTAMPGNIVDVLVGTGQKVAAGQAVLVIEAMKMENEIQASISGTVINLFVIKGDAVTPDQVLLEIQPE